MAEKLKGKGREKKQREMVFVPPLRTEPESPPTKPGPKEPPKIRGLSLGKEISERYEYIPASIKVIEDARLS